MRDTPYNEGVEGIETIGDRLSKYRARFAGEDIKDVTKYQHYVSEASKLTKNSYMQMHRRIAHAFPTEPLPFVLSKLVEWVHYSEKADNSGMAFNGVFKKFRESRKS